MPTIIYPDNSSGQDNSSGVFIIPKDSATEPFVTQPKDPVKLVNSAKDLTLTSTNVDIEGPINYYRDINISGTGTIDFKGASPILRCRNLTVSNANGIVNTPSTGPGFGDGFEILADNGGQDRQVIQIICSGTISFQDDQELTGTNGTTGNPGTNGTVGPAVYIKTGTLSLAVGKTFTVRGGHGGDGSTGSAAGKNGGNGGNAGYIEIELETNNILGTIKAIPGNGGNGGAGVPQYAGGNGGIGYIGGNGGNGGNSAGTGSAGGNGGNGGNGLYQGGNGGNGGTGGDTFAKGQDGGTGGTGGHGKYIGGDGGDGGLGGLATGGADLGGDGGDAGDGGDGATPGSGGTGGAGRVDGGGTGANGADGADGSSSPSFDFDTIAYGILKCALDDNNAYVEVV